jgi:hypothetical protein
MTEDVFYALLEKAKQLSGSQVVVKKQSDKDGQIYVFKGNATGFCCGIAGEGKTCQVDGILQLLDGKEKKRFPLEVVIKAIEENLPIIIYTGNLIKKREQRS